MVEADPPAMPARKEDAGEADDDDTGGRCRAADDDGVVAGSVIVSGVS